LYEEEVCRIDRALVLEEAADAMPVGVESCFGPLSELIERWTHRGTLHATSTICAQGRLQEADLSNNVSSTSSSRSSRAPEHFRRACWHGAFRVVLQIRPFEDDDDTLALALCEHWRKAHGICLLPNAAEVSELSAVLREVLLLSSSAEQKMRREAEASALSAEKELLDALEEEEGRDAQRRTKKKQKKDGQKKRKDDEVQQKGVVQSVAANGPESEAGCQKQKTAAALEKFVDKVNSQSDKAAGKEPSNEAAMATSLSQVKEETHSRKKSKKGGGPTKTVSPPSSVALPKDAEDIISAAAKAAPSADLEAVSIAASRAVVIDTAIFTETDSSKKDEASEDSGIPDADVGLQQSDVEAARRLVGLAYHRFASSTSGVAAVQVTKRTLAAARRSAGSKSTSGGKACAGASGVSAVLSTEGVACRSTSPLRRPADIESILEVVRMSEKLHRPQQQQAPTKSKTPKSRQSKKAPAEAPKAETDLAPASSMAQSRSLAEVHAASPASVLPTTGAKIDGHERLPPGDGVATCWSSLPVAATDFGDEGRRGSVSSGGIAGSEGGLASSEGGLAWSETASLSEGGCSGSPTIAPLVAAARPAGRQEAGGHICWADIGWNDHLLDSAMMLQETAKWPRPCPTNITIDDDAEEGVSDDDADPDEQACGAGGLYASPSKSARRSMRRRRRRAERGAEKAWEAWDGQAAFSENSTTAMSQGGTAESGLETSEVETVKYHEHSDAGLAFGAYGAQDGGLGAMAWCYGGVSPMEDYSAVFLPPVAPTLSTAAPPTIAAQTANPASAMAAAAPQPQTRTRSVVTCSDLGLDIFASPSPLRPGREASAGLVEVAPLPGPSAALGQVVNSCQTPVAGQQRGRPAVGLQSPMGVCPSDTTPLRMVDPWNSCSPCTSDCGIMRTYPPVQHREHGTPSFSSPTWPGDNRHSGAMMNCDASQRQVPMMTTALDPWGKETATHYESTTSDTPLGAWLHASGLGTPCAADLERQLLAVAPEVYED
jgi:hypothetical protein